MTAQEDTQVQYGVPGPAVDTFQDSRVSTRPFDEVVAGLRRGIEDAGMLVLNEIDPQAAVARFGHAMGGARLLFFFHPELVVRVLQLDWTAIVDAPLKLAVMGLADGTTVVRWVDPAAGFARYGNTALAAFGEELAATCRGIVDPAVTASAA